MVRRLVPFALVLLAGCLPEESPLQLVDGDPFRGPAANVSRPGVPAEPPHAKATEAAALKVMRLGRELLEANPQIGMHPAFTTVGAPHPEIFHRDSQEVWVTEGLVRSCKTDGQLAAVLALELGKMVSEREALAGPEARAAMPEPPPEVRVGNDSFNRFGPPDGVHLAELGRYEKEKQARANALTPPDPEALAGQYLRNAGYEREALGTVQPLVRNARKNFVLEKQMLNPPAVPGS
jgi:hypothetical protein